MAERKTGEVIESLADFWLGMAGAAAKGLSELTETRRRRKAERQHSDFVGEAAVAMKTALKEALEVADQVTRDLPLKDSAPAVVRSNGQQSEKARSQNPGAAPPHVTRAGKILPRV
jgi:hypothetical protein